MNCVLFFIFLFIGYHSSHAASSYSLGANSVNLVVDEFTNCKRLNNNNPNSYFIPTNTSAEWTSFLTHIPSGVSTSPCIWYDWSSSAWSSCTGGTGTWNYGEWDNCSGGYTNWQYGSWGSCSLACGGGVKYREATCVWISNTGTQARSSSCNISPNSGIQNRTVVCKRNDGVTVADSFCTSIKPSITQSCSPTSSASCGPAVTSQACTPTTTPNCAGSPEVSSSCNTQACCTWRYTCPSMSTCYAWDSEGLYVINSWPCPVSQYGDQCTTGQSHNGFLVYFPATYQCL